MSDIREHANFDLDTWLELLALETAALDMMIDTATEYPPHECALRQVVTGGGRDDLADLLTRALAIESVTIPTDVTADLRDLCHLEMEWSEKVGDAGLGSAVMALVDAR